MAYTTINKPNLHFNTLLRTGNYAGSGTTAITGVGFAPGLMWEKKRNGTSIHALLDQVRGNSKQLRSETDLAETTTSQYASIDSDGFTVNNSGDYGGSDNLVSWHWKANGQGSANNDGSINTTYTSANTTAGFSIVKWTGTGSAGTLGHGLGVAPKVVLVKNTINAYNWCMYHENNGNTKALYLNNDTTGATSSTFFNDTSPTNSVFSIGSDLAVNKSGSAIIAYCFAEKTGYSRFASYTGNGNADGTFVYTGFRPAFIMLKETNNSSTAWYIFDAKRNTLNATDLFLKPNASDAEGGAGNGYLDILSNGFKWRASSGSLNGGSDTYIYMAFAENPLVGSNGIPTTAK